MKLIAYYRVSTERQNQSGLGLDGQVTAVQAYAQMSGGEVVKAYREVESGKVNDRPELAKALAHAKRIKGTLVIAKLDRLARNVAFVANLMEAGVDFICCDNPNANRLTVHILAAVAEDEARRISDRTKAALAAFKTNMRVPKRIRELYPEGVPAEVVEATAGKLGAARPNACRLKGGANPVGSKRGGEATAQNARDAYADLAPLVSELRSEGLSLRKIAARLEADGLRTRSGAAFNPVQVSRVLAYAG